MNTTDTSKTVVYSVDLAKNVMQVHRFGPHGEVGQRDRMRRERFCSFFAEANTPRGLVIMEACGGAHHWGRWLQSLGYSVQLMPAQFVAKLRIGNKTDGRDADAIYAAYRDSRVRPVPIKSVEQQDQCALHRVRERVVQQCTQVSNQVRGLLTERGIVAASGRGGFTLLLASIAERTDPELTPALKALIAELGEEWRGLKERLQQIDRKMSAQVKDSSSAQLLMTIFAVGPVTASAFAADTGGRVDRYADARQFSASIGLTPTENSSGDRRRLGSISRRGNPELRRLLVQCAQTVVNHCRRRDDALALFARRLLPHKRRNLVIVAVANRMARIIYAMLKHGRPYQALHPTGS